MTYIKSHSPIEEDTNPGGILQMWLQNLQVSIILNNGSNRSTKGDIKSFE